MGKTQRQVEEQDRWFAMVLDENSIRPWRWDGRSMKGSEATFIAIDDAKESRYLVIVDPGFDKNGRVPHNVVLQKFRDLGFANFEVIGGGVLRKFPVENTSNTAVWHYSSDTIGNVPKYWQSQVCDCLGGNFFGTL